MLSLQGKGFYPTPTGKLLSNQGDVNISTDEGVVYTLRFGTKFGFSGACYVKIEGGYSCDACVNDSCESRGEKFQILWAGGDTVRLVNDSTGMLAENQQGGRDYLAAGGEHGEFVLRRAAPADCRW